jgi:hypothetical protein
MISRRTMLRLAAGAGAATAFGLTDVRPAAAAVQASRVVADEAYWISLAQVPPGRGPASGAIARFRLTAQTDWEYVSPYDGSVAARGMLLGGARYQPMVRSWIEWFLANLEWPDYQGLYGSIHDYWVRPSTGEQRRVMDPLTGQPRYDSTDAYPAVLLSLLVLPLVTPVLIFGAGAVEAVGAGLGAGGHLSLLGALLALSLFGAPLAAAALRISLD